MYRWVLSLLALLGITGMVAQAQNTPQSQQPTASNLNSHISGGNGTADGSTAP